jgi:ketosteroid isomerase-like protein
MPKELRMGLAAIAFQRSLERLLAYDVDGYVDTFAADATIEWPFAPGDWPVRRAAGREQIRAVVGKNLERSQAAGRRLVSLHDVVVHEAAGGATAAVEFSVDVLAPDGTVSRLPYVHLLSTTPDGHIASLRDYFGIATVQIARSGAATLPADDRLAVHELLALHGHLADGRRAADLDLLFTKDASYDLEHFGMGTVRGIDKLRALFEQRRGDQPDGHHVTNVIVTSAGEGTVRVRSKGLGVMPAGTTSTVVYDDELVKTPVGWRIARRKVVAPATEPARSTNTRDTAADRIDAFPVRHDNAR